jgi:predicted homoserine dehydrogenase-like protein
MRVGLAGFGTAGQDVARRLVAGAIPAMRLTAITARDLGKGARQRRTARSGARPAAEPAQATHSLTGACASCSGCAITSTRVGPPASSALRNAGSS